MSKDTADDKDNVLFKKLRKLINLIDQLRDCGVNEYIKLPRIKFRKVLSFRINCRFRLFTKRRWCSYP